MTQIPAAVRIVTACIIGIPLLVGCATTPLGPTARVMPAPGKPFEVFAGDQTTCKQFADGEVGNGAMMSNLKQFGTAAVSTALGGGLGAAVRGARGAGVGGAVGAIAGGSLAGRGSGLEENGLQGRYDLAYTQCMYSHGNQIAGVARSGQPGAEAMASAPPRFAGASGQGSGYPQPPPRFSSTPY